MKKYLQELTYVQGQPVPYMIQDPEEGDFYSVAEVDAYLESIEDIFLQMESEGLATKDEDGKWRLTTFEECLGGFLS